MTAEQLGGLIEGSPEKPGGAVSVVHRGEVVFSGGWGLADLETGIANSPATVFNTGSVSKQFTAFLVLLLEADGHLSLDDDVRDHLPELHDFGAAIRLRHLIHHTSGLRDTYPDLLTLGGWRFTDTITHADCLRLLFDQRELSFPPGGEYLYLNSNYVLLAEVAARAGGRPFAALCRERIFEPMGMPNTVIHDDIGIVIPNRAAGHYQDDGGGWHNLPLTDSVLGPTNVYSTADDLSRWAANFETAEVGGRDLWERMFSPGRLDDGSETGYACGLEIGTHLGRRIVEHGGQHGGYCAWVLHLPDDRLSVVVLYNSFLWGMRELPLRIADLFLGGGSEGPHLDPAAAGADVPIEDLEALAGRYVDPLRGTLREVEVRGGALVYLPYELELVPVSPMRFVFAEEPETAVEFSEDAMQVESGKEVYRYRRVEPSAAGSPGDYTGRYLCEELRVLWWVVERDGSLAVRRAREVETTLTPLFGDVFGDDWTPIYGFPATYTVVFDRDEAGLVIGFRLSGSRVRNLRFERIRP